MLYGLYFIKISMIKLSILLIITLSPVVLKAQSTIGESKETIRKIIQSNPNFKLKAGENCDTLVFTQGMQTVFLYDNNVCYKSTAVFPLKYVPLIIEQMETDSFTKVNENTWVGPKEKVKVEITVDKVNGVCFVTKNAYDKNKINSK